MVNNQNESSFAHDHTVGYVQKAHGTSHVSDCSRCDVFDTSGEELTLDNFKENGKRFPCDVSSDNAGCKRAKQIDNMDSFQGSPSSDEVACSGSYDLPWTNLSSPIWLPTFPNYCDYQTVTRCSKVKELSSPVHEPSLVHEYPSHRPVAIGPNHQALIPDWNPPSVNDNDGDSEKWIRYCVSPLNNVGPFPSRSICCDCPDEGSMRCVRQHIAEAREDIRRVFGQEKFEKLGFCDMGEEVALKWTAEEEKLFQEVVSSNPKSMDKNFWDDLPCAFPNKSSRDLVSYYFNVFILRKRAVQNRWDPTHIDSDDDEWEEPCPDEGSMRCVRQHIAEAREDIRRVFGQEKFEKLGFCDMGEEVALKWTAEEEKLFQEVVSSNPKSMDKNFWDDLPCAFPNKSSRDLVSYYFNVFILRKRAVQNRWDPTHIDSDDDEWEEPDSKSHVDEEEEEEEEEEQEEDEQENESAIESLSDRDDFMCNNNVYVREDRSEQSAEDEYYRSTIVGDGEGKEWSYFDFGVLGEDGNTDSCTSFDESLHCVDANNGFSVVSNHGIFDDLRVCDIDFPSGNGVDDFLSTYNVVDGVLRMEAWDSYDIRGDEAF